MFLENEQIFGMEQPLITVIVPVYLAEKYIHRCVDSILRQTYKNLEIILVDDGSPDKCGEICDEYQKIDSRVKVIHQENAGVSAARNAGIDVAKGEYIAFVDSDDYISDDFIEVLSNHIANVDYVSSGFTYIDQDESIRYRYCVDEEIIQTGKETLFAHYSGKNEVKKINSVYACGKLYNREIWEKLRFTEGIVFEDICLMPYILLKCNKVKFIPYTGYYYRKVPTSITNKTSTEHRKKTFVDSYKIWDEHEKLYRELGLYELEKEVECLKVDKIITHSMNDSLPDGLEKWARLELRNNTGKLVKKNIPMSRKLRYLLFALVGEKAYCFIRKQIRKDTI